MDLTLPVPGYPISDRAVADFLRRETGREPTMAEVGAVLAALARRDATAPLNADLPTIPDPVTAEVAPTTRAAPAARRDKV